MEQASFDALQSEDGQVRSDDDRDGVKDGALDVVGGIEDTFHGSLVGGFRMTEVADDVFHHDHRAIDNHAEIQSAKRQEICRNALKPQTCGRKQQRKRNRQRDDQRTSGVAKKQKQNDHHQNDAFAEIVEHRTGREVDQVSAVNQGNHSDARRQNTVVQLFDLGVNSSQSLVGICAFAQKHDP